MNDNKSIKLEDAFFMQEDKRLLDELKQKRARAEQLAQLRDSTGIKDETLLTKLLDLGLQAQTLAALSLVPLVRVAWADGSVDDKERAAVMRAAHEGGVLQGSPGYTMLEKWLNRGAEPALLEAWTAFAGTLASRLHGGDREALAAGIVDKARIVAEASGGFLGLGNKVSKEEQAVLDELKQAFV
jgi:hypothetical protein